MLRFSRRFGQPMATLAGIEAARGDAVVVIDCDLQDPPELIPELVARWREGYDVVYAQRRTRAGETLPKRIVAAVGYRVIGRIAEVEIPPNTGDFRLMSRRVVDNVVALKESHGFLRGLVGAGRLPPDERALRPRPAGGGHEQVQPLLGLAGHRAQRHRRLLALSAAADLDRSGSALAASPSCSRSSTSALKIGGVAFPIGNPTIVIVVSFFSGIQLLSLGVIGEYVGRIYDESRSGPKYIVESRYGLGRLARCAARRP